MLRRDWRAPIVVGQARSVCRVLRVMVVMLLGLMAVITIAPDHALGASSILGTTGAGPSGITIDSAGNIYTANYTASTVTKITPGGTPTLSFGTTGTNPYGITIDSAGNIYTANSNGNSVTKITSAGVSGFFGTTGASPNGITIDSAGNIYTTNSAATTVTKITAAGVSTLSFGTTGTQPIAITIDSAGNIYTANSSANTVTKITPAGVSSTLGTPGLYPLGITIDSAGNIYTANYNSNTVTKITPAGDSSTLGTTGTQPQGITIDSAGVIYTANYGANNVTKITSVPDVATSVAGAGGNGQVVVSWNAPVYNRGSAITAYTVTASPGGQTCSWSIGALSCTVTGLTNGTSYTFTVTATNSDGTSSASTASVAVTPVAVPDAATGVAGVSGDGQVVVSWLAPVSNGGSTITAYAVTASPGGQTCAWSIGALSCTITGLTNGVAYTFTVTATNAVGAGIASAPSSSVTPVAATILLKTKISTTGSIISITITAKSPGRLAVIGTIQASKDTRAKAVKVCSATKNVKKAGKVTLTCKLSKAARTARHKHALKVQLTTTFTPTTGVKAVSVKTINLKRR